MPAAPLRRALSQDSWALLRRPGSQQALAVTGRWDARVTRSLCHDAAMGSQHIASDLVANVHSVAVSVGDRVEAGQELVLLESMKMEIPVVPEQPGTVVEIRVQAGEVVQEGDVLVVLQ